MDNIRDSTYDHIPLIMKNILLTINKPGFLQIYGLINGFVNDMLGSRSIIDFIKKKSKYA